MKPMLPTLTFEKPLGDEWRYETKFDGFRAFLEYGSEISLTSRNGKPFTEIFPEIIQFLRAHHTTFKPFLPLILDCELVLLENEYKADFSGLQVRGRMRSAVKIKEKANANPCRLIAFDLLALKGKDCSKMPYDTRRAKLKNLFESLGLPPSPDPNHPALLQPVQSSIHFNEVWEEVVSHDGEGIVAKKSSSLWEEGKRTDGWLKYKNWKYVPCFITAYEKTNGYFHVSVYRDQIVHPIGQVLFGFQPAEKQALFDTIKKNPASEDDRFLYALPGICLELKYLEVYEGQLREPHFHKFRFDLKPEDCTYSLFVLQQKNLPPGIEVTHPDKPLWENPYITKLDYTYFLREISPHMLPFLKNRLLTVIRYPHGTSGEAFYQKNRPDYAPDFIRSEKSEGIDYLVCDDLKTLLWLGNQIAIEFHIPFQTIGNEEPDEIVFDLDPPSREHFHLAVKAALLIKEVLDMLGLESFIKTSGNKGLQIYIPLPSRQFSYEETRLFTSFIADYLVSKDPDSFTVERLKKNRGSRLYVDYVQHAAGKTIICPYSPRGSERANVAAPLFWEEVNESLSSDHFKLPDIVSRTKSKGCPFQSYFEAKSRQDFGSVLGFLKRRLC
ncbi:DNA ligase D [Mesobacillus zeae]|uniref:DNA ligase (ATP) n=1 Tax=Mesobacillus zeae TaxID=1917180 RepID=A0A398BCZ5_9BACI|nr:DNA ligase D [Mesobacillus zeae]RID85536.1 DNA ligase D [Mesobacillus zeae]